MKTIVLGSEGFIGGAVVERLRMRGVQPYLPKCTSTVEAFRLDTGTLRLMDWLEKGDTVYLCAGRTGGVGRMATDPFAFVRANVRIHLNVFEACERAGVRRVICPQSTTGYPDSPAPMREDQYFDEPTHPYYFAPAASWRFIDRLAAMHKGLEVVFFRPSNVYGPRNSFDPQNSHVIEATVRKVAERHDPFVIWGDGSEVRDAIYIDDLAEAMTMAEDCPPGAYNVASGEEMSIREIAGTLFMAEGYEPKVKYDKTKPTAIAARRVDITKARTVLKWEPKVTMPDGLVRTLTWWKENR